MDGRLVGIVPVKSHGKDVFVSIGSMGRILGFDLKPKSDTLIISKGRDKIQIVKDATAVWHNVQLVPLAAPAIFNDQRWWLDSRSAIKVMELLANSGGGKHSLVWKGAAKVSEKEAPATSVMEAVAPADGGEKTIVVQQVRPPSAMATGAELKAVRWGKYDDKIRMVLDLGTDDFPHVRQGNGTVDIHFSSILCDPADMISTEPSTVKVSVRKNGNDSILNIRYFSSDVKRFKLYDPDRMVFDFFFTGHTAKEEKKNTAVSVPVVGKPAPVRSGPVSASGLVVIDPGHGGKDPGAVANGVREKDVNLKIAKRIAVHLKKQGIKVRLTRTDDRYLKLRERTDLANKWNAAMFVSVHANALPPGRHATGTEIYLMALPTDKDAMQLALIENKELANGGGASESSKAADKRTKMLLSILGNMQQNAKIDESTHVAEVLFRAGKKDGLPMKRVAQAPFYVLRGAGMPAVLIETGFLTDRKEARLLASSRYQDKLGASIARGISSYLAQIR